MRKPHPSTAWAFALATVTAYMGLSPATAAPAEPSACSAQLQADGSVLLSWTYTGSATRFHVREYGHKDSLQFAEGDAHSMAWSLPVHDDPADWAIRTQDASGYSAACITEKIDMGGAGTEELPPPPVEKAPPPPDEEAPPPPDEDAPPPPDEEAPPPPDEEAPPPPEEEAPPPPEEEPAPPAGGFGGLPCSSDSFYKDRVGNEPVSSTLTSQFRSFMATHPEQRSITWPKVNVNESWAMSYDLSSASDPVWKLTGGNTSHEKLRILTTQGFHMADSVAETFPGGDQDRPGVIFDYANRYIVQFADAVPNRSTRTISVSNASIFYMDSNCLDYRNPRSDDERNFSSRGRITPSMVIPREFLDRAVANGTGLGYALQLFFVETDSDAGFVHPMVGDESGKNGWGAEGTRLRIAPDVNLAGRGLTGGCLAIARTLQENGAYVGDNSGSATQIKATQPQHYVGTNVTTDCLEGKVSWSDFEVVAPGSQVAP